MTTTDRIAVSDSKLDKLIVAAKRHVRLSGGSDSNGLGELVEALAEVVRDVSEARLREELGKPLPSRVPAEEEVKS